LLGGQDTVDLQGCQVAVTAATFHKCSRRSRRGSRGKLVAVSSRQVAVEGQKIHKSSREKFYVNFCLIPPKELATRQKEKASPCCKVKYVLI